MFFLSRKDMIQNIWSRSGFEKIKKNFVTQGFASLIILHDPTQLSPEEDVSLKGHEKSAIDTQIEKEVKEAMQKRIEERKKKAHQEAVEKKAQEAKQAGAADSNPKPLMYEGVEITSENIDDFIKDNEIDASMAKSPEGKLAIVKKWIEINISKK